MPVRPGITATYSRRCMPFSLGIRLDRGRPCSAGRLTGHNRPSGAHQPGPGSPLAGAGPVGGSQLMGVRCSSYLFLPAMLGVGAGPSAAGTLLPTRSGQSWSAPSRQLLGGPSGRPPGHQFGRGSRPPWRWYRLNRYPPVRSKRVLTEEHLPSSCSEAHEGPPDGGAQRRALENSKGILLRVAQWQRERGGSDNVPPSTQRETQTTNTAWVRGSRSSLPVQLQQDSVPG